MAHRFTVELRKHSDDSHSLRLVFLGPTSSGKSSTANSILGTDTFKDSPTIVCSVHKGELQGRDIWVIDTPGLSESAEVKREIQRSLSLGPPAPTVFLFIVDLTKIIERQWNQYLKIVEEIFGKDVLVHVMVLFTQREKITSRVFEDLRNSAEIQDLIKNCGGNCHIYSKSEVQPTQVIKLLNHIDAMKKMNVVQPPKNEHRNIPDSELTVEKCNTNKVYQKIPERKKQGDEKQSKHDNSVTEEKQKETVEEMRRREATERTQKDEKGNVEDVSIGVPCTEMKVKRLQPTKKCQSTSLNIILIGPTGSGKTSTANVILGSKAFPESPTAVCKAESREFQGRGVWVIDTPGLQESDGVKLEIKKSLKMVHDAPTVFLFVIGLSKTNSGKWEFYMKLTGEIFGKAAMSKIMILYIKRETLEQVGVEGILNSVEAQHLTRCCGGCHIMNSKAKLEASDVEKLLWKMKRMIHSSADVRIVLLGKTGAGKSSSGNTILGREAFHSDNTLDSVTATSHRELGVVGGRHVSLVDTPGLCDTKKSKDVVKDEIEKCVDLSVPGPHVFLVVMRLDVRHTQEEKDAVKWIQDNFGQGAAKFTMVLFTHADKLKGKSLEKMLTEELKTLISSCGGYHAFNNEITDDNTQVKELLEKIDDMVERNGGQYYTNEMYQEAQRKLRDTELTFKGVAGGAVAGAALGATLGFVPGAIVGAAAGAIAGGGGAAISFLATNVSKHPEAESNPLPDLDSLTL